MNSIADKLIPDDLILSLFAQVNEQDPHFSDLHFQEDGDVLRVCIRRGNQTHEVVATYPMDHEHGPLRPALERYANWADVDKAVRLRGSWDGAIEFEGTRLRINVFKHAGGRWACVVRRRAQILVGLEALDLPFDVRPWLRLKSGLILVCGAIGSGKSTTLAAMIEWMNQNRSDHIITIEDPIEHFFTSRKCLITQRELGPDAPTYADAIYGALRQAPQVLMVGEIRDYQALMAVLHFTEAGHLVLATLHSESIVKTIERIVDMSSDRNPNEVRALVSGLLKGVIVQTLVPDRANGRKLAAEVLSTNMALANMIREGQHQQLPSALLTSHRERGVLMSASLERLVSAGLVTAEAARAAGNDGDRFKPGGIR